ncbi:MAG: thioredoxin family protein [Proteobacteria bacterium]|nr:thioredoxin family protein [Pseudomonadota bacterium]
MVLRTFVISGVASLVCTAAAINEKAPDFSLASAEGKTWKLSDQKGKVVVLEWFNAGCPFVKKHYDSQNMQALQKEYTAKGVVWLTMLSSAPGKQGYATGPELKKILTSWNAQSSAGLLDPEGKVGKLYGAKTTPHLFVINKEGVLVYEGAIDDNASADPATVKGAKNYVRLAVDAVLAGQSVKESFSKPYGCSVKYP